MPPATAKCQFQIFLFIFLWSSVFDIFSLRFAYVASLRQRMSTIVLSSNTWVKISPILSVMNASFYTVLLSLLQLPMCRDGVVDNRKVFFGLPAYLCGLAVSVGATLKAFFLLIFTFSTILTDDVGVALLLKWRFMPLFLLHPTFSFPLLFLLSILFAR